MKTREVVRSFLDTCHLIQAKGMVSGSGGNISVRCEDGVLITPSGRSLESLKEEDLVILSAGGKFTCANGGVPSKEWRMHLACYNRQDINALVHVHSSNAVAVSCIKGVNCAAAIPVYTPGYCMRVGDLPVLPYLLPGSQELSDCVAQAIEKRNSVLLANHGSLAVGRTLEEALNVAEEIEEEARLFLLLGNNGVPLTEEQQGLLAPRGMRV